MNAFTHNVDQVKLHKRELPRDMIASGAPEVRGRILEVGKDGCIALTPVTFTVDGFDFAWMPPTIRLPWMDG
jgi:hypothetical protein